MSRNQSVGTVASDPLFPRLKELLIEATGLSYYQNRDEDMAHRIERRLSGLGIADCSAYLRRLREGPEEMDALIEELTIGETYFFRHSEQFDALREIVFPDIIERNRATRSLRIWSAGCASGAEPYSVSILLRRHLSIPLAGWHVSILGTDINRRLLARAREARFADWELRTTPEEDRHELFSRSGQRWILRPEYVEGVSFQYQNLVGQPFPSLATGLFAFDLILCRNVAIYFREDLIARLLRQLHDTLVDGGWLLTGHSETGVERFRAYRTVLAKGTVLYQKSSERTIGADVAAGLGSLAAPAPLSAQPTPGNAPGISPTAPIGPAATPDCPHWIESPVGSTRKETDLADLFVLPLRTAQQPGAEAAREDARARPDAKEHRSVPLPGEHHGRPSHDPMAEVRRLGNRGELREALRVCSRLLESDRLCPAFHFQRGLVLEQLGRSDEAEEALRHALYLDRHHVFAHYHMGLHLQKRSQLDAARRSFGTVLKLLAGRPSDETVDEYEEIAVADLVAMAAIQLEALEGR